MHNSINNKQNKVTVLVAQDEALDFYFDSLLLTDENDSGASEDLVIEQRIESQAVLEKPQPMIKKIHSLIKKSQPLIEKAAAENKLAIPGAEKKTGGSSIDGTNSRYIPNKLISKGSVYVEPGEAELNTTEQIMNNTALLSSAIVFSEKDKEGKEVNQILIPRSQTVETANKAPQRPLKAKSSLAGAESLQQKQNKLSEQQSIDIKEAPELDLSLFLPGIKTLSDEEIKQQPETATRVAENQLRLDSDMSPAAELEQELQQKIKLQDELNVLSGKPSNAPSWAETDFQILLFTVSGLKLAIPLNELNGILHWGDEYINELPGHASWYLGLVRNQGVNIPVIDTLQQIVPESRWPENYIRQRKFKHIILIDNNRWGLACEKVLEVITLKTDAVKWRSSRTKRRWLSGTVIAHMCALLDSSEFSAMLKTGDDSI